MPSVRFCQVFPALQPDKHCCQFIHIKRKHRHADKIQHTFRRQPDQSDKYAASKAGLIGFTQSCAKELAGRGITVNAIAPGFIETDMTAELKEEMKAALLKQIPLGCLGQSEDIAGAALYLASPAARYVTGQVLTVDGGMVM